MTRGGLRLTRTSVSLGSRGSGFAREARLSEELRQLDALKTGPGGTLYETREDISAVSRRVARAGVAAQDISSLADRLSRIRGRLFREASGRRAAADKAQKSRIEREESAVVIAARVG